MYVFLGTPLRLIVWKLISGVGSALYTHLVLLTCYRERGADLAPHSGGSIWLERCEMNGQIPFVV